MGMQPNSAYITSRMWTEFEQRSAPRLCVDFSKNYNSSKFSAKNHVTNNQTLPVILVNIRRIAKQTNNGLWTRKKQKNRHSFYACLCNFCSRHSGDYLHGLWASLCVYHRLFSWFFRTTARKKIWWFFFGFFSSKKWVVKSKNDAERGKFSD